MIALELLRANSDDSDIYRINGDRVAALIDGCVRRLTDIDFRFAVVPFFRVLRSVIAWHRLSPPS